MTDMERLAAVETTINHLREDVREMAQSLDQVERHITVLVTQRDDAEKRLSRLKTAALSVASGLAVAGFIWIAHIAMVVQAAKIQP